MKNRIKTDENTEFHEETMKAYLEVIEFSKNELALAYEKIREQEKKEQLSQKELTKAHQAIEAQQEINNGINAKLKEAYRIIEAQEATWEMSRGELKNAKKQFSTLRSNMSTLETELSAINSKDIAFQEKERLEEFGITSIKKGDNIYVHILNTLVNTTFSSQEAQKHWQAILTHMEEMNTSLNRRVGIRVAIMDYFCNIKRILINPKIIEINLFEKTMQYALKDELTGVYNRKFYELSLEGEISRSKRNKKPFCLLIIDLDNFKVTNDKQGHNEGDKVLKIFGEILSTSSRKEDIVCRYGGDEFIMILPEISKKKALATAKRLHLKLAKKTHGTVSFSGGVACFPQDASDAETLFQMADKAMYKAKINGKNQTVA